MYIRAQVALYPLESVDADHVINQSIESLNASGLEFQVGPVSTELMGQPEQVWRGLRQLFDEATIRGGEVSMVVTVTNSQP